ncbi:carbohydrate kinase family protein [Brachybacterium sp. AOP42-C2-15]|uniref:carbohydrate kinase family protein n=1 Tax=unclassified Brachybacterium TaxID=2623841 RepID=UPI003F9C0C91
MNARFLIVGEALTDIVVDADGVRREHPGGSPLNVAVALSRLGHPTDLLTRIGNDARGDAIRAHLEASGVRLTAGSSVAAPTSTALAQLDVTGAATYEFDLLWDPDPSGLPAQIEAVHTSSIAAVLDPGASTVLDVLRSRRESATISYDPNARPSLMGAPELVRERVEASIALSDVVKASDEDVAWLYGTDDVEDVVASWRELGPALTVMTRGAEGAVGFAESGRVQVSPVVVDAVDTVGAGDTFSAGILDALAAKGLLGAQKRPALAAMPSVEVASVLRRAAALAAITVSRAGANPPWSHELS